MLDQQTDLSALPKKKIKEYISNLFTSKWKTYSKLFSKSEAYRNFKSSKFGGIPNKNTKQGNKDRL